MPWTRLKVPVYELKVKIVLRLVVYECVLQPILYFDITSCGITDNIWLNMHYLLKTYILLNKIHKFCFIYFKNFSERAKADKRCIMTCVYTQVSCYAPFQ